MIKSIDTNACTGCGACTKNCPLDVFRLNTDRQELSPCMNACPAGVDIRTTHYLIQQGRLAEAVENYRRRQPFPAITGRVCFHPCEGACARRVVDEAVNINGVERFLGDYALEIPVTVPPVRHITKVAVVGSGPAGLSCAYFLNQMGYPVTVFEAMPKVGGMLRYGIPAYRLPDELLDAHIHALEESGISFRCSTSIGEGGDLTLDDLQKTGFRAVMLAPGAGKARHLDIPGIDSDKVLWGLDFLRAVRCGETLPAVGRVIVVGGGDVAVDAAITAKRLGSEKVTIISLEDREHLPAYPHNQQDAVRQSIEFLCGWSSDAVTANGNGVSVVFRRCLSVTDAEGRFSPVFGDETMTLEADRLIFAIGQYSDLAPFENVIETSRERIVTDAVTGASSVWGVFAAGDAATGPASVAAAIGGGRECADSIDRMLKGADLTGERDKPRPVLPEKTLPGKGVRKEIRHNVIQPDTDPVAPFAESSRGLDMEAGFAEALRCMTCGSTARIAYADDCMTCFNCEINCPSEAIYVHPFKERFARTLDQVDVISETGSK